MASHLSVDADLEFSVDIEGSGTVAGTLTGSGHAMELRVSHPFLLAGRSDSGLVRSLAKGLAGRGLSIRVVAPAGPLVTLGAAKTSWLQRRVTGSRYIRVERLGALWSLFRGSTNQAHGGGALPTAELAPPPTLAPLAPTMSRRRHRPATTTHDPYRGGNPRLIMAPSRHPRLGELQKVFPLGDDVTTIGASADCDICLPGLEPLHAEIRHDDRDEFVLVRIGEAPDTRVHGAPVETAMLRTGSGVDLGTWHLSFYREEYADHGRPYGGRIGGELGHQRPQPSREWQRQQIEEDQ